MNAGFPLTKKTIESMMVDFTWFYKFGLTNLNLSNHVLRIKANTVVDLMETPGIHGPVHFHYGLAGYEFTYHLEIEINGIAQYYKIQNEEFTPSTLAEMQSQKDGYLAQVQIRSFGTGVVFNVNAITTNQDMPPAGVPTCCSFSLEQVVAFLNNNESFIWNEIGSRVPNPTARLRIDNAAGFLNTYQPAGYNDTFKLQVPVLSIESDGIWRLNDNPIPTLGGPIYFEKGLDIGNLCPPNC